MLKSLKQLKKTSRWVIIRFDVTVEVPDIGSICVTDHYFSEGLSTDDLVWIFELFLNPLPKFFRVFPGFCQQFLFVKSKQNPILHDDPAVDYGGIHMTACDAEEDMAVNGVRVNRGRAVVINDDDVGVVIFREGSGFSLDETLNYFFVVFKKHGRRFAPGN